MRKAMSLRKKIVMLAATVLFLFTVISSCPRRGEYIGTFDMSHYCLERWDGEHICGNSPYGSGGEKLVPEKSLAVPASVLSSYPEGTKVVAVYPDGGSDVLVIQDTGGALERLGRIDMAVKTHSEALRRGVIKGVKLYILK